jgi:hypothetical protein
MTQLFVAPWQLNQSRDLEGNFQAQGDCEFHLRLTALQDRESPSIETCFRKAILMFQSEGL